MAVKLKLYNNDMSLEKEFDVNSDKVILKQIIEADAKIFYGCQGGSCGACACFVDEGEELIDSEAYKKPTFSGLEPNQILVCCSKIKEGVSEGEIKLRKRL
jgi:ferredoxin